MSSNGTVVCEICGGLGVVTRDVPVDHPDFGKAFPCVCQADKLKVRKATQLRTLGNLDAFVNKTFATFQVDYDLLSPDQTALRELCAPLDGGQNLTESQRRQINTAAEIALRYADDPRGWLLLQGSYGTGKTHLAAAIGNRWLDQGEAVLFITTSDLLDHLRGAFGPSSEIGYDERFEQIRNAPRLILDDLGAESPSNWAMEKLYQIFGFRYERKLSTVVTTNIDLQLFDARIRSRLVDQAGTRIVRLTIPDRRSGNTGYAEEDLTNLDRYRDMRFETFEMRTNEGLDPADLERLELAVQLARQFAENPQRWLVLIGEPGCGKTHLAAAIAHVCKANDRQMAFVGTSDLLDHLRITFSPGSSIAYDKRMQEIKDAEIVILDNLIIEKALSSWAREKLFEILIYRFDYNLPTVITTYQRLEEMNTRLSSRIKNKAHSTVVPITVPAFSGKSAPKRRAAPPRGLAS